MGQLSSTRQVWALSHRWWRYTEAVILFPNLCPFYFDYALVKSFCELVILAVNAQLWRVFIKSYLDGRWNSGPAGDSSRLVALVIFIGGVTFAEISALRFLSAQVSHLPLVSLFCLILLWVTKTLSLSHWSRQMRWISSCQSLQI